MTANTLIRNPLWATLLAALVAAVLSFFVFVQGGAAAQVADKSTNEPRIINGEPVPDGKYPFMSFLTITFTDDPDPDNKPEIFNCGGSLIDADSMLTAAHCVSPETASQRLLDVEVFVGRTVLSSDQGEVRFATKAVVHPKWDTVFPDVGPYDVAVLQLNRKVSNIKPIELATSNQDNLERPGRHATVAGWGDTVNDPDTFVQPNRMREAQIPIVSDSRAERAHTTNFFPPLMIGAGGKQTITCQGDSGGPLFVRTSGNGDDNGDDENRRKTNGGSSGKYTQIGITSYGPNPCLSRSKIAVYTEVNAKPIARFIERAAGDGDDDGDDKQLIS